MSKWMEDRWKIDESPLRNAIGQAGQIRPACRQGSGDAPDAHNAQALALAPLAGFTTTHCPSKGTYAGDPSAQNMEAMDLS